MKGANMKKAALGIIALAMSFVATTARAGGDIRSIDPWDPDKNEVKQNGSMAKPYTAGETVYFRIRLENSNSEDSWYNKSLRNPWRFEFILDPSNMGSDTIYWNVFRPAIGVIVNGSRKNATVVSIGSPVEAPWYTDIICSYTVQPGDLALPMTLADSSGNKMGDGNANDYYLETPLKKSKWVLYHCWVVTYQPNAPLLLENCHPFY